MSLDYSHLSVRKIEKRQHSKMTWWGRPEGARLLLGTTPECTDLSWGYARVAACVKVCTEAARSEAKG